MHLEYEQLTPVFRGPVIASRNLKLHSSKGFEGFLCAKYPEEGSLYPLLNQK